VRGETGTHRRLPRLASWLLDHPLPAALAGLVLLAGVVLTATSGRAHRLTAVFSDAVSLVPGLDVQVDGIAIGQVQSVRLDGDHAVVGLAISQHWPLPEGTTATIRWGSTLGLGTRYVQLAPGPASAPALRDGAVIPQRQTTTPVELDQFYDTFDSATRAHLRGLIAATATATQGHSAQLGAGIAGSSRALQATSGLLSDLDQVQGQLSTLVAQGARATATLASRQPAIEDLIRVASATFTQFGTRTTAIRSALDQFAPALAEARGTLARTRGSLRTLDALLTSLRPGLSALHPFIAAARPALAGLRVLAPLGASTLQTLTATAPRLTSFLRRAQPFSAQLAGAMGGLAPQVACIRPYAPEIAGLITTWASWGQDYDNVAHYARVKTVEGPTSFDSFPAISTSTFLATQGGGIQYAMPRPPGLNAGQPWFLPQCGAGRSSLDPTQDPENQGR
jgi:virulence factor Mce-like protein